MSARARKHSKMLRRLRKQRQIEEILRRAGPLVIPLGDILDVHNIVWSRPTGSSIGSFHAEAPAHGAPTHGAPTPHNTEDEPT